MTNTFKFALLFLVSLSVIFSSCDDNDPYDGGCGLPPSNIFFIQLQNSQGENLIETLYTQEKFDFIEAGTDRVIEGYNQVTTVSLAFHEVLENTDYYISWDENDTDTLSFKWKPIDTECFNLDELTEVKHNNIELNLDNGVILIQ